SHGFEPAALTGGAFMVERKRFAILCGLLITVGMATTTYAADSASASADDGSSGYYGQFYERNEVPAAGATVSDEEAETAREAKGLHRPRRYIAPDASGLVYQPGFHGCAPGARINFSGRQIRALAPPPLSRSDQNPNRYLRFGLSVGETYSD